MYNDFFPLFVLKASALLAKFYNCRSTGNTFNENAAKTPVNSLRNALT